MTTAFVCPIRAKYDEPTDRPGDLEGTICPVCWTPFLLTGRKGATVTRLACGHVVLALEAGEVTIKARLLRGACRYSQLGWRIRRRQDREEKAGEEVQEAEEEGPYSDVRRVGSRLTICRNCRRHWSRS